MRPDYLEQLADVADPEQLWRLDLFKQRELPEEKRHQLDIGVALRRHADHIKRLDRLRAEGKSLLITPLSPNSTASLSVDPPPAHQRMLDLRASHITQEQK